MSFSNQRTEAVQVEKPGSKNFSGDVTYSAPVAVQCRVQRVEEMVTDQHGDEVRSTTVLYLYDDSLITYEDKITMSDSVTRLVLKVRKSPSLAGRKTLVKIWLK